VRHAKWFTMVMSLVTLTAAVGCSEFDLRKNIPWGAGEEGEMKVPMKVAAIWTDTVLNASGQPSKRGFGGRLMFYAAEGGKPVKVKGSLVVYAFDERLRDPTNVRPDRKYVFTTEQFEKHYSKSALGHSYSVWLPWDDAGGPRREISLLVRFTPENGPAVVGDESRQMLPGAPDGDPTQYSEATAHRTAAPGVVGGVQPVAYHAPMTTVEGAATSMAVGPIATTPDPSRRMSTTTISIPSASGLRQLEQPAATTSADAHASTQGGAVTVNVAPAASWPAGAAATASPEAPQPVHFGPQRRRPLGAPLERLTRDHAAWPQGRLAPPSSPPAAP